MRIFFILLYCLFTILFFVSCNSDKTKGNDGGKDGLVKNYDVMGRLVQEVNYKDGKVNGLVIDYYRNGKVLQEVNYVNNVKQGVAKRYYEDGTLLRVTPYDSGKINGVEYKYRKNGKLAFEAPYYKGEPCIGLIEYLPDGTVRTKYPYITVTPIDNILASEKYTLRIALNDGSVAVKYYLGKLTDGKYIGKDAEQQWTVKKGVLTLSYYVPSGSFVMERINIIAKVKTFHNNYYITQKSYNVAVENRY